MLGNTEVADIILPYLQMITGFLSEQACRLIELKSMDMNLIEVLSAGVCFNIKNKRFELMEEMKDCTSLRAFVRYQHKEVHIPYPQEFVERTKCFPHTAFSFQIYKNKQMVYRKCLFYHVFLILNMQTRALNLVLIHQCS